MEDVNFRLATERIQVIMYSNYGSRKYFGRKSFDEEFENILKRLKSIPSVECPFQLYICFETCRVVIFSKIPP